MLDRDKSCPVCHRRRSDHICDPCRERTRLQLTDIPDQYARLTDALQPGSSPGGTPVSGTRTPPLPLRVDVLNLVARAPAGNGNIHDPYRDQFGPPSIFGFLVSWENTIRAHFLHSMKTWGGSVEQTVTGSAGYLLGQWDLMADEYPAAPEFAAELAALMGTIRAQLDGPPLHTLIGHCPVDLDTGGTCGAKLHAEPFVTVIRCPRCHTDWPRERWLILGATLRGVSA